MIWSQDGLAYFLIWGAESCQNGAKCAKLPFLHLKSGMIWTFCNFGVEKHLAVCYNSSVILKIAQIAQDGGQ